MTVHPLYATNDQQPAYALRYSWTGWVTRGDVLATTGDAWTNLKCAWESDGLRLLDHLVRNNEVHLTFSTIPSVSPTFIAARAKGRLKYAQRIAGAPVTFSRKVSIRSVGDNTADAVEGYIRAQVRNEGFIDSHFSEFLEQFTVMSPRVDLRRPTETNSGRYWYNLHLVLVTDGRHRLVDDAGLTTIRDSSFRIAAKKEYAIRAIAVMPDHVHIALRGNLEHSPEQIALAFQNNLAHMLKRGAVWQHSYYVGTFGVYDMRAIRMAGSKKCSAETR